MNRTPALILIAIGAWGCQSQAQNAEPVARPATERAAEVDAASAVPRTAEPTQADLPIRAAEPRAGRTWTDIVIDDVTEVSRATRTDPFLDPHVPRDRVAVDIDGTKHLIDEGGRVLGSYPKFVRGPRAAGRYARGGPELMTLVSLDDGSLAEFRVSNMEEALRLDRRAEVELAEVGPLWLAKPPLGKTGGVLWVAPFDRDNPTTAVPVELPTRVDWAEARAAVSPNWLVVPAKAKDCPHVLISGDGDANCVEHTDPSLAQLDRVFRLQNGLEELPPHPACQLNFSGLHPPSQSVVVLCAGRFGVYSADRRLLLSPQLPGLEAMGEPGTHRFNAANDIFRHRGEVPRFVWAARVYEDAKGFTSYAMDMQGSAVAVSGKPVAMGEATAVVGMVDGFGALLLTDGTVEALPTPECAHTLRIEHHAGDLFLRSCVEFDRSSVKGKTFECGLAAADAMRNKLHWQDVVDLAAAKRYTVPNHRIQRALPQALVVSSGYQSEYVEEVGAVIGTAPL